MKKKITRKYFQIDASTKRVFESFVNPDIIKKWLCAHSAVVAECKNGPYAIGWDASEEGDFYCCNGKIKKIIKYKKLNITDLNYFCEGKKFIGPIDLIFSFRKKRNTTEVNFTLIGVEKGKSWSKKFEAVLGSWEEAFYLLKKHLERSSK